MSKLNKAEANDRAEIQQMEHDDRGEAVFYLRREVRKLRASASKVVKANKSRDALALIAALRGLEEALE